MKKNTKNALEYFLMNATKHKRRREGGHGKK
jgi:hypothetical protein